MAVRGDEIRQPLAYQLPGGGFQGVARLPRQGSGVDLEEAARVLLQPRRGLRPCRQAGVALRVGQDGEVPIGGQAHQGVPDVGVFLAGEELHQHVMGIREGVDLPFLQEPLRPVAVEELRAGVEAHRDLPFIRLLLQKPQPAQGSVPGHAPPVRLLVGGQDDIREALHGGLLRHPDALLQAIGPVVHAGQHMIVDIDVPFFL